MFFISCSIVVKTCSTSSTGRLNECFTHLLTLGAYDRGTRYRSTNCIQPDSTERCRSMSFLSSKSPTVRYSFHSFRLHCCFIFKSKFSGSLFIWEIECTRLVEELEICRVTFADELSIYKVAFENRSIARLYSWSHRIQDPILYFALHSFPQTVMWDRPCS
jgi:hypothetical protein